ncbi:TIGR02444 family protein [Ferrimonas balearica]|uniref:TIGR02444 family protein n=1 Tax=Ferrimonas balearica TaxID=44012 RepID=UPI001C99025A|nr:TIGR02444 family protein [Ferrimonas balearica]MBY5993053.1 TIGR02444 family protein [Ferrimonas balearica]
MIISADAYWQFSEGVWRQPGARHTALEMQDRYGLEPNLLLLALMLEQQGQFLDEQQFRQLELAQSSWSQRMLTPYRQLRRLAKHSLPEASYRQMLEVELVMEKRSQQLILKELAHQQPAAEGDNLVACLEAQGIDPQALPGDLLGQLSHLFKLADPDCQSG